MNRSALAYLLFTLVVACAAGQAFAQTTDYPNRPVRVIVPTTAGSGVDVAARTIAQKLTEAWGQSVIVENRPGANGIMGMEAVAKAKPDGYTLLQGFTSALTINPYASVTMRTQFATGYTYDLLGNATAVSAFMDPGFFTQSIGAAYTPAAGIKTRLGLAMREVLTSTHTQFSGGAKSKTWAGGESVTDAKWEFAQNMQLISRLEVFAPFNPASDVFVRFDNTIAAKVNEYVNVSFNVQTVYDGSVSGHMQVKQVLAIGLSYQFI